MNEVNKYTQSEKTQIQRQDAARKHGVHSFKNRGENALDPTKKERLSELRRLLAEEPGRQEYRLELTARMAMICELGFSHLGEQEAAGVEIWEGGIIRRLATYVAETRRLMDSCEDQLPQGSAAEFIAKMLKNERRNTGHS